MAQKEKDQEPLLISALLLGSPSKSPRKSPKKLPPKPGTKSPNKLSNKLSNTAFTKASKTPKRVVFDLLTTLLILPSNDSIRVPKMIIIIKVTALNLRRIVRKAPRVWKGSISRSGRILRPSNKG
jgi:hypothetical protein